MNFDIHGLARTVSKWRHWPACANPVCKGNALKQAVGKRHFGVSLGEQWFCGPDCFERGAQRRIVELLGTRHIQEKAPAPRMPLGLLLLSRGTLTHEQLKTALDQQRATGMDIGEAVQNLGFATAQQVTAAVAAQWACPVFSVGDRPMPSEIRIPRRLMEMYAMLPVHYSQIGRKLMVGFVRRVQHHLLYTIELISECAATPCFISSTDYRRGLQSLDLTLQENEIVFDRASSPLEIASTVHSYVSQSGAERARFGICRDYLWVRVVGRQEIDLLFRLEES